MYEFANGSDPRSAAARAFVEKLGPLLELTKEYPDATDVVMIGPSLWLKERGRKHPLEFPYAKGSKVVTPRMVEIAADHCAVFAGVQFGEHWPASPKLSIKIPPDLRVSFVRPPMADQWQMRIRFLRTSAFTLEQYVEAGVMTEAQMHELRRIMAERKNIVVSGAMGSGKTTLLRALLAKIDPDEWVVVLEDTPELALPGRGVTHMTTTAHEDLAVLLRQALRMSGERIIVGEVRGPEALELVRSWNTGHSGGMATIHSNGKEDALRRLHSLVVEAQPTFPMEGIRSAVDYVVQLEGEGDWRRLADIWRVPKPDGRSRAKDPLRGPACRQPAAPMLRRGQRGPRRRSREERQATGMRPRLGAAAGAGE